MLCPVPRRQYVFTLPRLLRPHYHRRRRLGGLCRIVAWLLAAGYRARVPGGQPAFVLNPVRANMVANPAEYRWSSYRTNAQGEPSKLLAAHPLYTALGRDSEERRSAYRELFRHELDPGLVDEIRQATNSNYALGNARFKAQVEATLGRRVIPGKSGRPRKRAETVESGRLL